MATEKVDAICLRLRFDRRLLVTCPECHKKNLFPPADDKVKGFNAIRKRDGVQICADCGDKDR